MADDIPVQVAYARPDVQTVLDLSVPSGTTARAALKLSALASLFPELDLEHCPLGIFGRTVADDHVLRPQDRLEVYRPLEKAPRDARRELAARDRGGRTPGVPQATKVGPRGRGAC